MMGHVDRAGNPISYRTRCWRFADDRYRVVKQTYFDDVLVSTIWIGRNKRDVFETMTFVAGDCTGQNRHSTEKEAVECHDRLVDALKATFQVA